MFAPQRPLARLKAMCGRYRLKDPKAAFEWMEVVPAFEVRPRFNIAPTQRVPVATSAGRVEEMQWGIVPVWAKDTSKALINARSESVREKRSFKSSFTQRRCLVPADGFYEWTKIGKIPHFFTVNSGAPFAIAGIWDEGDDMPRCRLPPNGGQRGARAHPRQDAGDRPARGLGGMVFTRRAGGPELSAHHDPVPGRGDVGGGGLTAGQQRPS